MGKTINEFSEILISNLEKVILGKRNVLELVVIGLLSQGHLLIDDVPGVGKTVLAKALANSIGCQFKRIQFTPDMLPSDVTGISIFNQVSKEFEYRPGPIMTQILLADEINRATPKTQSSLLEAMEEKQVTVDGITHFIKRPFIVLATQNPIEYEGTFPLPEAQLDRFFMRIQIGYPNMTDEMKILNDQQYQHPLEKLKSVTDASEVIEIQEKVKGIFVDEEVKKFILSIVRSTREHKEVYLGSSPRGSLGLIRASQIYAGMNDRDFVIPDDVKYLAESVLMHRIIVHPSARLKHINSSTIVREIVSEVPVPIGNLRNKVL